MKTSKIVERLGIRPGPLFGLAIQAGEALRQEGLDAHEHLARALDADAPLLPEADAVPEAVRPLLERLRAHAEAQRATEAQRALETPRTEPLPYADFGASLVDPAARAQMTNALRLPIAAAGALMPDAHVGYGLPIGGVLATDNAVVPYAVGVDIACRMMLTVYPVDERHLDRHRQDLSRALVQETAFGAGAGGLKRSHAVLDDGRFGSTGLLRRLKDKAAHQLGSSGGGNHFVEWGLVEAVGDVADDAGAPALAKGQTYLALLSHSGSRGVGFAIANHYTDAAMKARAGLPQELKHLAWLSLDEEDGAAYWEAMHLAGDFASACHHVIHKHVAKAAGLKPILSVENHHNFAWKEVHDGREVLVHRKGATPAGAGVRGIIPGSMAAPGFVVEGLGHAASLGSASHGAGRQMGRKQAARTIAKKEMEAALDAAGVTLLGGGRDEAPQAYKPISEVMAAQTDLVRVLARFRPKIVRMADDDAAY